MIFVDLWSCDENGSFVECMFFFSTEIFVCWFYSNDLAIPIVGDIVIHRVSAERPLRPNLCQKKCDSRSPILSRYDQVPF